VEREIDYENVAVRTAHEECAYCTEILIVVFNTFKITVADSVSSGVGEHYAAIGVSAAALN